MKTQILKAMKACKQEIETTALITLWTSRLEKMATIVKNYQRTLDPHDFCPSIDDLCRFPDTRKVIVGGADEEFEEVTSRFHELTSQILEERIAKLSALIPFSERPDNVLSLATVWFNCEPCRPLLIHGTDALKHECSHRRGNPDARPVGEVTFDAFVPRGGWCAETSKFTFSIAASTIARGLILDCGEDPESMAFVEMNSKLHRFVFEEIDKLFAYSWADAVSFADIVGVFCSRLTTYRTSSSSISSS